MTYKVLYFQLIAAFSLAIGLPVANAMCFKSKQSILQEISNRSSNDRKLRGLVSVINRGGYRGSTPLLFVNADVYTRILTSSDRIVLAVEAPAANIRTKAPVEICERDGEFVIRDLSDPKSETPIRIEDNDHIHITYNDRKIRFSPDPSALPMIQAEGVRTVQ